MQRLSEHVIVMDWRARSEELFPAIDIQLGELIENKENIKFIAIVLRRFRELTRVCFAEVTHLSGNQACN